MLMQQSFAEAGRDRASARRKAGAVGKLSMSGGRERYEERHPRARQWERPAGAVADLVELGTRRGLPTDWAATAQATESTVPIPELAA